MGSTPSDCILTIEVTMDKFKFIDVSELSSEEAMKKIEDVRLAVRSHLELYKVDPEFANELGLDVE